MRALWTGSLSFGLINVPVRLYSGSESRGGIELNMLHKSDLSPISYSKVCRRDGKEVPYEDIVKGYEYQEGDYVVLTDADLDKANSAKSNTIDIKQFTNETEIDVRYFEKPYYLEPAKGADKPYALLREALSRSKKIAISTFVLRNREHLAAVKAVGKALVLNQMRFTAELRDPAELKLPAATGVDPKELSVAIKLIEHLSEPFVPEDFHDTYTEDLEEIIEQKVKGEKPKQKGSEPVNTQSKDLMAMLLASLDEPKGAKVHARR